MEETGKLEESTRQVIHLLELAQEDDGYLNTYFQLKEPDHKWQNLLECHELYCAGHLIEAAVADYEMSGRSTFLNLAMRLADRLRQPVGLLSGGQRQALTLLMATMVPPKLLLLDEHTAALDPATAEKVLRLTREIVEGERITCLMITHNMKNALELGSRTFMMDAGRVVLDISGEERKGLTVDDLLERFRAGAGKNLDNDRILLSND